MISGKPRLFPSRELFINLRILPVDSLNKFKLSMFCFKYLKNELPNIFDNFFTSVSDVHDYFTRSSSLLYIHTPRTIYAQNSVQYLSPLTWNSLDSDIRDENCLTSFKRKVINYFICTL